MKTRTASSSIIFVCILLLSANLRADEGMWLLTAIGKLPLKELRERGLKLSPTDLYNPAGPSIKDAIVLLGGGTGSFVSANGLMLTNHHVAYGALQRSSTPQADYIRDGFHARTLEEEIPARGYTAQLLEVIRDVTGEMKAKLANAGASERETILRREGDAIVKAAVGKDKDLRGRVQEMNGGQEYLLFLFRVLRDVRLVYAPPLSIGNYGGEIDNWMWPRHTGDFTFMRAYVGRDGSASEYSAENVPYKPKFFLKFSRRGTKDGDLIMILGYPGRTFRYRTSHEIAYDRDVNFPLLTTMLKANIDAMEKIQRRDKETEIKYASRVKSFHNGYKNRMGMIDGLKKMKLAEMKAEEEASFTRWLADHPEMDQKYGDILPAFKKTYDELRTLAPRQITYTWITRASTLLEHALTIARWHGEREKPDAMRAEGFRDADTSALMTRLRRDAEDMELEQEILGNVLYSSAQIPLHNRLTALASVSQRMEGSALLSQLQSVTQVATTQTKLLTAEGRIACLFMPTKDFNADPDPLIRFARNLSTESSFFSGRYEELTATVNRLRDRYVEALSVWKNTYLYPDANRSMRLSYGSVRAYSPRDGIEYTPYTKFAGVIEKNSGEDPFDMPDKLQLLYDSRNFGEYADKSLGDVPVAFLSDADITGGNSGSPVVNGSGELVGCAFDGVYEGLTNDFKFDDRTSRTISVDSRYILFILDKFAGAKNVLDELTIVK